MADLESKPANVFMLANLVESFYVPRGWLVLTSVQPFVVPALFTEFADDMNGLSLIRMAALCNQWFSFGAQFCQLP